VEVEPPPEVSNGLGVKPNETYRCRDNYLAIFENEGAISSLSPNMDILGKVPAGGVIASAPGCKVDFVSRYFAPQAGIPEDPVTGSAHTALVPYWSKRLGKQSLHARQISKRGGELVCKDLDERIEIGGRAVTYLVGEISL
jgi:PhzF family phenazine biosynthesis protein